MGIPVLSVELVLVLFLGLNVGSITERLRSIDPVALCLFSAFTISAALSMLLARTIPTSARFYYAINFLHVLSAFLLFCRFRASDRLRMAIVWAIGGSLAVYCVIVVAYSHSVSDPDRFEWIVLGAGVTNVRQLAFYALTVTGMAGALTASAVSGRAWLASTLLLFAGIFLCFWCGGRAAVGALCVQQAFLVICARTRRTLFLAALAFCGSIAIPLSVSLAPPSPLYGAQAVFGRIISQGPKQSYDSGRSEIWRQTAEGIMERPLFGHGEGQFRWEVAAVHRGYNHPHNLILQFLYQWGCVGTVLFFLLLGRIAGGPASPDGHEKCSRTCGHCGRDGIGRDFLARRALFLSLSSSYNARFDRTVLLK